MKTKTILSLILTGVLAFSVACEKKEEAAAGDDQAEAVEAEGEVAGEQAEGEANAGEGEQGASAKAGEDAEGKEAKTAVVGEPAPDFELKDDTGKAHKLSDYKGKMVVLEWTRPACPYVERHYEAGTMTKTQAAIGDDVVWLAIDSSQDVTVEHTMEAKKEWSFDHPVLQNPEGDVGKLYEAKTTPHMYVIDKEGVLRYKGAIDDDERGKKKAEERTNYVTQAVQALQKGEEVPTKETKPYGCSVKYGS